MKSHERTAALAAMNRSSAGSFGTLLGVLNDRLVILLRQVETVEQEKDVRRIMALVERTKTKHDRRARINTATPG